MRSSTVIGTICESVEATVWRETLAPLKIGKFGGILKSSQIFSIQFFILKILCDDQHVHTGGLVMSI